MKEPYDLHIMIMKLRSPTYSQKMAHLHTPHPSGPVRCTPVASPVNKFVEIVSPVSNYTSLAHK